MRGLGWIPAAPGRCTVALATVLTGGLMMAGTASAQLPINPPNDLFALGEGMGQLPEKAPVMTRAEPPLVATPRAVCDADSHPEPGIQGRVPAGTDANGYDCNLSVVSHAGQSGGFKVLRYVDPAGHECAIYDTALLFPTNATNFGGTSLGVKVLDMSDPAHPVESATLTDVASESPHESLVLNQKRGLLADVNGNPSTGPGIVSIYDLSGDCRHPVMKATGPYARSGHESGFSPDGKTFYATATAYASVTAIDVTDPSAPSVVWQGQETIHGMTISADGNTAYGADPTGGDMVVLDTSQIQARKPNPQVSEISRLTWKSASIPQNVIAFTDGGHPYVLEFDEYTAGTVSGGNADDVGAGRIIDMADPSQPKVVSDLRLQVDQPADHAAAKGDPGTTSPAQGYAAHYCNIPTQVDPTIVACSFIASGLRVFDISDLLHPKELGYFVRPSAAALENGYDGSNYAMSQPAFVPARNEIWYTDGGSGFYDLRLRNGLWPQAPDAPGTTPTITGMCSSKRSFPASLRVRKGQAIKSATATLGGKKLAVSRSGRTARVKVRLTGSAKRVVRLVIKVKLRNGQTLSTVRTYHPCTHK